jgi:hypothetical protein
MNRLNNAEVAIQDMGLVITRTFAPPNDGGKVLKIY